MRDKLSTYSLIDFEVYFSSSEFILLLDKQCLLQKFAKCEQLMQHIAYLYKDNARPVHTSFNFIIQLLS